MRTYQKKKKRNENCSGNLLIKSEIQTISLPNELRSIYKFNNNPDFVTMFSLNLFFMKLEDVRKGYFKNCVI